MFASVIISLFLESLWVVNQEEWQGLARGNVANIHQCKKCGTFWNSISLYLHNNVDLFVKSCLAKYIK